MITGRGAGTAGDLDTVFRAVRAGILVADPAGKVSYANPRALELLGFCEEALLDRVVEEVVPPVAPAVRRCLQTGEVQSDCMVDDGELRIMGEVAPLRGDGRTAFTFRAIARVYELFPRLAERRSQLAETLSGGEQQMVAVGRGLMQDPDVIMFDEPSPGLTPILVSEIFRVAQELKRQGLTVFLVEQNVHQCLKVADSCYVIENGRVVPHGSGRDLEADPRVREVYLGL
jgi:PAS domain S-box-containing protein